MANEHIRLKDKRIECVPISTDWIDMLSCCEEDGRASGRGRQGRETEMKEREREMKRKRERYEER